MASSLNPVFAAILNEALSLLDSNKAGLLARAAAANVSVADLLGVAIDKELDAANLGPIGSIIKPEIKAVIDSKKADLVVLAGSEEALLFALLEAKAKAYIATLTA